MDVTFLAINYAPSIGGAQTLVRRVAEGLVERHGHRVSVLTTDTVHAPGGSNPGRVPVGVEWIDGVEVVRMPVARRTQSVFRTLRVLGARLGRPITPSVAAYGPWGARLALAARSAAQRSDVIVGVSAPFTTIPAARCAVVGRRCAFVAAPLLHLGEWEPSSSFVRVLGSADRCIALTSAERDWLVSHGLSDAQVSVVPPGVDDVGPSMSSGAARRRIGLSHGPTVVFIGRLTAEKGVDTLLAAVPALVGSVADLTVILAGHRTGWRGLPAALGTLPPTARPHVVVLEDFDESDRSDILGAADVVVVPSREEAFGIVVLEAWSCGRPVVASNLSAIRSFVDDGVDGVLVEPGDVDGLATAVLALLRAPDRAAKMGSMGRDRVIHEFAWGPVVDRWNDVLSTAVGARRSAA